MIVPLSLLGTAALAIALMTADRAEDRPNLRSPFPRADLSASVPVTSSASIRCPKPPQPVRDVIAVSKYGEDRRDHDSTIVDEVAAEDYAERTRPLTEFSRRVSTFADGFTEHGPTSARDAHCALLWISSWAQQEALLGKVNSTGQAVRKWELATLGTAYLKIRSAPHDAGQAATVRRWLGRVADEVRKDYSSKKKVDSRLNNHLNWAAWAVMVASIAADDDELFDWSIDRFHAALAQIEEDGTLPLELKRRHLAAAYHNFAVGPLIMLREGAIANNVRLSSKEQARLQRLVDVVLTARTDPRMLEARSGYPQDLTKMSATHLAWLEPYHARSRDPRAGLLLGQYRPLVFTRMGGNLTMLFDEASRSKASRSAVTGGAPSASRAKAEPSARR